MQPWAKTLAGRAHFELVDYKAAADDFENARRLDPSRLDGMEVKEFNYQKN